MRAVDILRKKRDGGTLSAEEITHFVTGATTGSWAVYQVSAMLMAIVCRGMNATETAALTRAMIDSGETLDWNDLPGRCVDKHSTGGVGDKTSLILGPLAASCGVYVPKMSGRGLGHSGGTLDKLEAIPGFRVRLEQKEMRRTLEQVGLVMMSPTERLVPADRVLYHLRDVTATVESIPLIASSIMSKKLAEGISGLVLDVKCGCGAFMKTLPEARVLGETLVALGTTAGVRTEVLLTAMDVPLGRAVGNALEVKESIKILKGAGDSVLRELCLELAARLVRLGGVVQGLDEARHKVREALTSGRGLEKFRQMVQAQGGDPRIIEEPNRLPAAAYIEAIRADRRGYLWGWNAEAVGRATVALGGGRDRAEDSIDPGVGVVLSVPVGAEVRPGELLLEIHYSEPTRRDRALQVLQGACRIEEEAPAQTSVILGELS